MDNNIMTQAKSNGSYKPMSASEYNRIIASLGRSRRTAAEVFGVSVRQSQRFGAGDLAVPKPVAKLARAARRFSIPADVLEGF